jgi:hypothetical protein
MEEKNSGLALLQAGLSMMQSKGRGLSGIAEGAGVGLNAYKSGMDKISSAKEKIDEARDQIEQYRRNEDMLTSKEARALKAKANDAIVEGQQKALDGTKQAFGVDSATALKTIELSASDARAQQENATKLKAAGISANAPSTQIQLFRELGNGNVAEGAKKFAELQRDVAKPPSYDQLFDNARQMLADPRSMTWQNEVIKEAKAQGKPKPTPMDFINMMVQSQLGDYTKTKAPPPTAYTPPPGFSAVQVSPPTR